jgi:hypothetical protein
MKITSILEENAVTREKYYLLSCFDLVKAIYYPLALGG